MKNKSVIICPVGDNSLHRNWNKENHRFDTCLVYYGNGNGYEGESLFYRRAKGQKYHIIKDTLDEIPDLMEYEFVWLPDDDLCFTCDEATKLFDYMQDFSLLIAQPSIMGWYNVDITLHQKGSLLRYTNWVEIMCPCFDSGALRKCKKVFKENKTGWSIETIWNILLEHPRDKIAIIDDVVVVHTRAPLSGDSYSGMKNPMSESMEEAKGVYNHWKLSKEMEKDLEYGTATGGEVYGTVVYSQISKHMEIGVEKPSRFWPPCDLFRSAVKSSRIETASASCISPIHDATASD